MKAALSFVPPGGGEQDYALEFDLRGIPQPGDYVVITRPGEAGSADFIVRRTWWYLDHPAHATTGESESEEANGAGHVGRAKRIIVECEFAVGPYSSKDHKAACQMYKKRGKKPKELDSSTY